MNPTVHRNQAIRVLVVDDSAVMRAMLRDYLERSPGLKVVGTAASGTDALLMAQSLHPDVVTLDVQMPGMDGLQTLDRLLAQQPVPVIMVSALTQHGATVTLEALDRGALDCVGKPQRAGDADTAFGVELVQKIQAAVGVDIRRIMEVRRQRKARAAALSQPRAASASGAGMATLRRKCVAIGISTGGPPALAVLFEALRPPMPPIVVVQHMPPQFTGSLAWRLDSLSQLTVKEAASGDLLRPDHVLIAPGGAHLRLRRRGDSAMVQVFDGPAVSGHRPSIDVMMQSAAEVFGSGCLGVIMTGMGHDGVEGCRAIRAAGGYVLGQDEASSDVYGMNKVAYVQGHVDRQFSLEEGAAVITAMCRGRPEPVRCR